MTRKMVCYDHWCLVARPLKEALHREYERAPRSEGHLAAARACLTAIEEVEVVIHSYPERPFDVVVRELISDQSSVIGHQ